MKVDVVIVGAGIIGCAIARRLSRDGVPTVVVDRDEPGSHASWAAAGMLAPQAESDAPNHLLPLLLEARALFQEIVPRLREETGLDLGYSTLGMLLVAFSVDEDEWLRERYEWQMERGLEVQKLTADEARSREPSLSGGVTSALFFANDHTIDNRLLTEALRLSAESAGAEFRIGVGVRGVHPRSDGATVELENGETIEANRVVIAAGSWSGSIAGLPRPIPVEPVHGQLIGFRTFPALLRHAIASRRGYLVPRADGRIIAGTTAEKIGYENGVTTEGLRRIERIAFEMVPALAEQPVAEHWSGLRPGTPDGLPIIGPDPDFPALFYATGHFRNGILLGPITGEIIANLISDRKSQTDVAPFSSARFGRS